MSTALQHSLAIVIVLVFASTGQASSRELPTNRKFEHLKMPHNNAERRALLEQAAKLLGDRHFTLAGIHVDAAKLAELAQVEPEGSLLRGVRENLQRPIDLRDFLYLLDDVVGAPAELFQEEMWISAGRARSAGVLIHPDDVFKNKPRRYGERAINIDKPARPATVEPAPDGTPLGPGWSARYEDPSERRDMLDALKDEGRDFDARVESVLTQLEKAGTLVYLTSTLRRRERGYLMWGAFYLSRADSKRQLRYRLAKVKRFNQQWGLNIPIVWEHPDGLDATQEAARRMADAYDVVYATITGAKKSDHYDKEAVDFVAIGLPRTLTLVAPDGVTETFDLSHPDEPRDLSLTPRLIDWIEQHFGLEKLESDYPHWNDDRVDDDTEGS